MCGFVIFGTLLNVIKDIVDGLFGVVAGYGALDVGQEFGVMFNGLGEVREDQGTSIIGLPCRIIQA
jgi:hypothetical protein